MHIAVQSRERVASGGRGAAARVAIAGATGYTGQELLRLLARHPAVTIAAAMSSGAQSPRPRAHLPRRGGCPRSRTSGPAPSRRSIATRSRARPTSCFSRFPTRPPRNWRPRWSRPACASSTCPAPSGCAIRRCAPGGIRKRTSCRQVSRTGSRSSRGRPSRRPGSWRIPAVIRRPRFSRLRRSWRRASSRLTPTSSSTRSPACRARARHRPSGRTFPKCTAACRRMASSDIVTAPKSSRASAGR